MKKAILATILASSALVTHANNDNQKSNFVVGVGYINLGVEESIDGVDLDYNLTGILGTLGYRIQVSDSFYIIPEVGAAFGIGDDSVSYYGVNINVELENILIASIKGQVELDNGLYFFGIASYADAESTAKVSNYYLEISETENSDEFGIGFGIGYSFNSVFSLESTLEDYDGTNAFRTGVKFNF